MTVGHLDVTMPLTELYNWQAYFSIENEQAAKRAAQDRANQNVRKRPKKRVKAG